MEISHVARGVAALAVAALLGAAGLGAAQAQENSGSLVTVGNSGGTDTASSGAHGGPGVTISGGAVTNETGIDVIVNGGSSDGGSTGGSFSGHPPA